MKVALVMRGICCKKKIRAIFVTSPRSRSLLIYFTPNVYGEWTSLSLIHEDLLHLVFALFPFKAPRQADPVLVPA